MNLLDVQRVPENPGKDRVQLVTDRGSIECRFHPAEAGDAAILWVFGAGGGLGGPAGGLYTRLGERLQARGVASLELAYRIPGALAECVLDTLLGLAWLEQEGRTRIVLVGHSFGGAVVISAAHVAQFVIGVAALSSQTAGTSAVGNLAPRPLLFVHGEADEVLPVACSLDLHARAKEPKRLILYPECRHGLDECRDALDSDLVEWLEDIVGL